MVQYLPTVDLAFAALADPTRRAVLERLGSRSTTISELAEPFGMSLTGMKKHIRLLEEAQLGKQPRAPEFSDHRNLRPPGRLRVTRSCL
jgi:DNA-binding transcriptional ArsR family regulator